MEPCSAGGVRQEEARGFVSSVFRDIRARMPFVPAIFERLASEPPVLLDAWLHARALLDDAAARSAILSYAHRADPGLAYRASPAVRRAVAPFAEELPVLLLVVTSLRLSLDGVLPPPGRRPSRDLPEPGPLPATPVRLLRDEHPVFDEIRAVYGTQHVPSMFRALAAERLLDEPWRAVGPFLASDRGRALVGSVALAAERDAARLGPGAVFRAESARPLLEQFAAALPRNLIFAAAVVR